MYLNTSISSSLVIILSVIGVIFFRYFNRKSFLNQPTIVKVVLIKIP